ncbi:hypothetical protein B0H10DRAFT_2192478 [Mycena sp. CBHHK59/15]|nr:hypothetical protein B0H10DRAFT_2192478 [Mycena sp. CBHHK59/15]
MGSQTSEGSVDNLKTQGSLLPITSNTRGRYESSTLVDPFHMDISSQMFMTAKEPEPSYLPHLWSVHVHPEGKLYFSRSGPLRVVTEDYMYQSSTSESVCYWIECIEDILSKKKVTISRDIELFIKIKENDCAYYFVDHSTRIQFWLEDHNTVDLGLPPVISASQLKILLGQLYWSHVEHFPMHLEGLSMQTLDHIISVFSHGLCGKHITTNGLQQTLTAPADQMTSRVSTFPYTAQDCKTFMDILQESRGNLADGHTTWIIARLWSLVDNNKYLTHYGQENARLSRDQAILYDPEQKHLWISVILSCLSFKISEMYQERLDDVFVDHIVYTNQWEKLMSDCLQQWRGSTYGALSGLMCALMFEQSFFFTEQLSSLHLPFLVLGSPLPVVSTVSISLFGSSLMSSIFLTQCYEPMQRNTATQAMNYLETIQSPTFKFQFVALVFSLPKMLQLWGFLVLLANCILLAAQYLGFRVAIGLSGLAIVILLTLYCTTSEIFLSSCARLAASFRRQRDQFDASPV